MLNAKSIRRQYHLDAPWHFGMNSAGKTTDWMPTDTKENFEKLMQDPVHAAYFRERDWDQPGTITYKINFDGFRCDELDSTSPNIIALGCSYTFGVGLPLSATWPKLVADDLGLVCHNLAWPGTSADTCFMLARYWVPKLKPSLVVMAAPPVHRFDLVIDDTNLPHETFMPGQTQHEHDFYIQQWFLNDRNAELNNAKNKLAVKALCAELNIPCLTYNAHEYFARSRDEVEYARDYMHAGPKGHTMFSERIIDDWRKKYT